MPDAARELAEAGAAYAEVEPEGAAAQPGDAGRRPGRASSREVGRTRSSDAAEVDDAEERED